MVKFLFLFFYISFGSLVFLPYLDHAKSEKENTAIDTIHRLMKVNSDLFIKRSFKRKHVPDEEETTDTNVKSSKQPKYKYVKVIKPNCTNGGSRVLPQSSTTPTFSSSAAKYENQTTKVMSTPRPKTSMATFHYGKISQTLGSYIFFIGSHSMEVKALLLFSVSKICATNKAKVQTPHKLVDTKNFQATQKKLNPTFPVVIAESVPVRRIIEEEEDIKPDLNVLHKLIALDVAPGAKKQNIAKAQTLKINRTHINQNQIVQATCSTDTALLGSSTTTTTTTPTIDSKLDAILFQLVEFKIESLKRDKEMSSRMELLNAELIKLRKQNFELKKGMSQVIVAMENSNLFGPTENESYRYWKMGCVEELEELNSLLEDDKDRLCYIKYLRTFSTKYNYHKFFFTHIVSEGCLKFYNYDGLYNKRSLAIMTNWLTCLCDAWRINITELEDRLRKLCRAAKRRIDENTTSLEIPLNNAELLLNNAELPLNNAEIKIEVEGDNLVDPLL